MKVSVGGTLLAVVQALGFENQVGVLGLLLVAKKNRANPVGEWTVELYLNSAITKCSDQSLWSPLT